MSSELSLDAASVQAAVSQWLADDTRHGFFVTDTRFRVVVWNRWMEIHSGNSASAVAGRSLFELFPDAAARGVQEYYEHALAGGVTVLSHGLHRYLLPLPPTNSALPFREMPQSGHVGPLFDRGRVIGTVSVVEDISDRLASETELRTQIEAQRLARATAEKALQAKDEFLSTLSHEIRTPLNAVLGWTRLLRARDALDLTHLDHALQVIERNAVAQARMIDDMLDMARIIAGKLRVEMHPVDLLSVVLAAVDVVMPSATAKGLTVKTSLDPGTPHVLGDQDRLQQIVWNLLSNAVKFTPANGTIEVRLEAAGKSARVVVSDTGQGIAEEFLPYVFDRFRQNDTSSSRRHGGLGLGLALVRELVELHGGTISAASDGPNRGATFAVTMPAIFSPEIPPSHRDGTAFSKESPLEGVRILLVEDESDARELALSTLAHCGAAVTAVSSTSEALDALLAAWPDTMPAVLVSDIGMPREDGYALIRQVRSLGPERGGQVPAIAVTGYATPQDVDRAMAAGYQIHVPKPVNPSALISAISRLVRPGTAR